MEGGGRGGVGQTDIHISSELRQAIHLETVQEDVEQFHDDPLPTHEQPDVVLGRLVQTRVAVLAHQTQHPEQDQIKSETRDRDGQMDDEYPKSGEQDLLLERRERPTRGLYDELPLELLQRK